MADIVNLNRARKAKARATAKTTADRNSIAFGRNKAQKAADTADAERRKALLDGAKLDRE